MSLRKKSVVSMRRLVCASILWCLPLFGSDWPKYCGNLQMTGVAASSGNISPSTARSLTERWIVPLPGAIASSPTIVNGKLYIGDWNGDEWSIDTQTGEVLAVANLGTTTNASCNPQKLGITSSAAIQDGKLFIAGGGDSFYALDPETLDVVWKKKLGDSAAGYYGWCSPAVVGSIVLQGISSNCDTPFIAGQLVSMNGTSGEMLGQQSFVPGGLPLGGGVWTSPAVDIDNHDVFVTTGSAYDISFGNSFSIVRVSLEDFTIRDAWKISIADWQDSDWGTSPTLFFDVMDNELVGAGQKDGSYYAFYRQNLGQGPLWKTPIAVGGGCPQCGAGILSTAAFDGERIYVGSGQPLGDASHLGAVTALDATTGEIVWQHAFDNPVIAPMACANGVVFTTTGKSLVALSAESGELLGTFDAQAECVGGVAITDDGIYFGDLSGKLFRVAASGVTRRRSVTSP